MINCTKEYNTIRNNETQICFVQETLAAMNDKYILNSINLPVTKVFQNQIKSFLINIDSKNNVIASRFNISPSLVLNLKSSPSPNMRINTILTFVDLFGIKIEDCIEWNEVNQRPEVVLPKYQAFHSSILELVNFRDVNSKVYSKLTTSFNTWGRLHESLKKGGMAVNTQVPIDKVIQTFLNSYK